MTKPFAFYICITLLLIVCCRINVCGAVQTVTIKPAGNLLYKESHALLVGVSDYYNGWPPLPGVKHDIKQLKKALESHGFQVTTVMNPNSSSLETVYKTFVRDHGLAQDSRLLFYFAGHGYTVHQKYGDDTAYIVPADAPNPNTDKRGFLFRAMPISFIENISKRIDAKHALFIFDSCFSGSIFALSRSIPPIINYKTAKPVRQFITSGAADEEVPDKSIFLRELVAALKGEGDVDRDGFITGSELGFYLNNKVVNYSHNTQHPQYGKIRNPSLDKGDFVFRVPGTTPAATHYTGEIQKGSPADELLFWDTIKTSSIPADFEAYLRQYPKGIYVPLAKIRLQALATSTPENQDKGKGRQQEEKIASLIKKVRERMQKKAFTRQKNDSALFFLEKARQIAPTNSRVKKLSKELVAALADEVEKSLAQGNIQQATAQVDDLLSTAQKLHISQQQAKTLQKKIVAEKTRREREKADKKRLATLLARADKCIQRHRLTVPANDNAISYLRQAWKIAPGNSTLVARLQTVLQRLYQKAEKALAKKNVPDAEKYSEQWMNVAGEFHLNMAEIASMRQHIAVLKEEQQTEKKRRKELDRLLAAAGTAIKTDRLTGKDNNNAVYYLRKALTLDSGNVRARTLLENIVEIVLQSADEAEKQHNLDKVQQLCDQGSMIVREFSLSSKRLKRLQKQLAKEQLRRATELAAKTAAESSLAEAPRPSRENTNTAQKETAEPQAPEPIEQHDRITALLAQARLQIKSYKLTSPKKDNALATLREVLRISPDNRPAHELIAAIVTAYIKLAKKEISMNNPKVAKKRIDDGRKLATEFGVHAPQLQQVNKRIDKLAALQRLLATAETSIAENDFPAAGAALGKAEKNAKKYGLPTENIARLQQAVKEKETAYRLYSENLKKASDAYARNDVATSRDYLDKAVQTARAYTFPDHQVEQLQEKLEQRTRESSSSGKNKNLRFFGGF